MTPELVIHCEALLELFDSDESVAVYIRPSSLSSYRYYVGDASHEGLGGATQYPDGTISVRRRTWSKSFTEGSSNLREAQNQFCYRFGRASMMDALCGLSLTTVVGLQCGERGSQQPSICSI